MNTGEKVGTLGVFGGMVKLKIAYFEGSKIIIQVFG